MEKKFKALVFTLCAVLVLLCCSTVSSAHSGRTDSQGGHRDNRNVSGLGSYHFHHGYSPHLHLGDYCPYTDVFPSRVSVSAGKTTLGYGEECSISATVSPANSCNTRVTWASSDDNVVKITNDTIKAVGYGTATITATSFNDKVGSVRITVKEIVAESVTLEGIEEGPNIVLIGESKTISAKILPENVDNPTITWTSSNEAVATVKEGCIQGVADGTATITAAAANGVSAQVEILVQEVVAEKIDIEGPDEIIIGNEVQLQTIITPANTTYPDVKWTSSDEGVATVSEDGMLSAIGVGEATISAIQKDVQAEVTIQVIFIPVEKIEIALDEEFNGTLTEEENTQFSAAVFPETATYPNISWATSDESIATIDEAGVLTAISKGDVVVYARTTDGAEESIDVHVRGKGNPVVGAVVLCGGGYGIYKAVQTARRKKKSFE